jgi:coenzyme F420-0:L-glutamate ligase / coenzyme F420-1:gamma-L-glutamate ligase
MSARLELVALPGLPEIASGDALGELIAQAAARQGAAIDDDDILCVSQKVVSKAEGRTRHLSTVEPGARARELAAGVDSDPRLVELILSESRRVVRADRVLIVETNGGWVCANAGIDTSNVPGDDAVALLPLDADASARAIRGEIASACGKRPGVIVADSFGRPWRVGQTDVAIGCAGVAALDDWRGRSDAHGRTLAATAIAAADGLAAAADLARSKTSREPVVLIRGAGSWRTTEDGPGAVALQRDAADDLFR